MSGEPRAQTTLCGWQRTPGWIQMVVTCKMTVMLLPLDNGGVVMGLYGGKMKIGDFLVKYGNVGYKIAVLTCQPSR